MAILAADMFEVECVNLEEENSTPNPETSARIPPATAPTVPSNIKMNK